jgi:PAS domain S-box-containing protein
VAFLAIIPFAYLLARYHYFREEWVEALSNQVTTSKLQEENLLANINDAVIVVDRDLKIVLLNLAAQNLTLYKDVDLFGKSIYAAFNLKDNKGNLIDQQKLPLQRLIDSKASITERGLHLSKKDSTYVEVDLKVSPVIDSSQNAVGLMLIAKDVSKLTESERLTDSLTELSFRRFFQISEVIKKNLANLPRITKDKEQKQKDSLNIVIEKNEELIRFTNDFLTVLKIDSGEVSGLVTLIDLYPIVSKTLTDAVKISVKDANVNFIPHDLTPDILPVKEQVFPAFKREMPVFADPGWLSETLTKILYVSVELSNNNQVDVNLEEVSGDAKISFSFKVSDFPGHLEKDLFKKYYGKLSDYKELVNTSGFEIYIASELLERIGGNLSVEHDRGASKMSFLAKIPRAPMKKEQVA